MEKTIISVEVNGIAYVPAGSVIVDCDGHTLTVGQSVKVRLSALGQYDDLNESNRHGTLVSADNGELQVQFDTGFSFPVYEIRRA